MSFFLTESLPSNLSTLISYSMIKSVTDKEYAKQQQILSKTVREVYEKGIKVLDMNSTKNSAYKKNWDVTQIILEEVCEASPSKKEDYTRATKMAKQEKSPLLLQNQEGREPTRSPRQNYLKLALSQSALQGLTENTYSIINAHDTLLRIKQTDLKSEWQKLSKSLIKGGFFTGTFFVRAQEKETLQFNADNYSLFSGTTEVKALFKDFEINTCATSLRSIEVAGHKITVIALSVFAKKK